MNINENENLELRNKLIEEYLPVVNRAVDQILRRSPKHIDSHALYSAGTMGLISACQRYQESHGDTFPSYLKTKITGAILDEMRKMDSCSRRGRERCREMKKAATEFEQENSRPPTQKELAQKLQMPLQKFLEWSKVSERLKFVHLDAPAFGKDSSDTTIGDILPDENSQTNDCEVIKQELNKILITNLSKLSAKERKILILYYYENVSFVEIAKRFRVTKSRIGQIHKEALSKLKKKIVIGSNKEILHCSI